MFFRNIFEQFCEDYRRVLGYYCNSCYKPVVVSSTWISSNTINFAWRIPWSERPGGLWSMSLKSGFLTGKPFTHSVFC